MVCVWIVWDGVHVAVVQHHMPGTPFKLDWQELRWEGTDLHSWAAQRNFLGGPIKQLSFGSHHSGKLLPALFACGLEVEARHWNARLQATSADELAEQLRRLLPANAQVLLSDPRA